MLTLKTAYTRRNTKAGRWLETDLANEYLRSLPAEHGDVILIINIPNTTETVKSLSLRNLTSTPLWDKVGPTTTVKDWLSNLNETTLPYDATTFTYTSHFVRYNHLFHAGYDVQPIARDGNVLSKSSNASKSDLFISKPGVPGTTLGRYGLYSVNGFFHLADYDKDGVYLFNGNTTVRKANDNQVGVMSFTDVGEVKQFPITDDMISGQADGKPLKDALYITMPKEKDLSGYIVLFVFGGYLHAVDGSYDQVGDRTYRVHIQQVNILERYYASRDILDLSSLNFTAYPNYKNDSILSLDEALSDASIKSYLKLSQSFVVAVKSTHLFSEFEPIENPLPGRALLEREQFNHQPIVGALNRHIEYHPQYEQKYVIFVAQLDVRHNYLSRTYPYRLQGVVDGKRIIEDPWQHASFYMHKLGVER